MFPKALDGANVLYYTPCDNFGKIYWDNREIAHYIKYLAICKYLGEDEVYLGVMNNLRLLVTRRGKVLKYVWGS